MPSTPEPEVVQEPGRVWRVRGLGSAAAVGGPGARRRTLELLRARATAAGARVLSVDVSADDAELATFTEGTKVLGRYLTRPVDPGAPLPAGFGWRPMSPQEYAPWLEAQVAAYAADNRERSGGDEAAALERSRRDFAEALPAGLATTDTALLVLVVDAERVGHLWLKHHREGVETFGYDLEVVPERRRQGWGRASLALAARLAAEAGDTRLGLHVFGANARALRLYESAGFAVRSTTHDLLTRA